MGGSFNGKEQDSTRGIYALAGQYTVLVLHPVYSCVTFSILLSPLLCYIQYILVLLLAADVFRLNRVSYSGMGLVVSASYFEIYCSKVFDLLNVKKRLRILEDAHNRVQV